MPVNRLVICGILFFNSFSVINRRLINDATGEPLKHRPYGLFFPDGTWLFGTTDDEGWIIRRDIRRIGYYNIIS